MPDTYDFYKILQVDPSAEPDVIKAAYRVLALKYHPDHNKAESATEKMKQINHAYEVLKDAKRRAEYNANRNMWASSASSYAANQPSYYDDYEPTQTRWYSTDKYTASSFSFMARNFRQSRAGKLGFWVGLILGIIYILAALPNIIAIGSRTSGGSVILQLIIQLWLGIMIFLIAWGVIWSVGDLLEHIYRKPQPEETEGSSSNSL